MSVFDDFKEHGIDSKHIIKPIVHDSDARPSCTSHLVNVSNVKIYQKK